MKPHAQALRRRRGVSGHRLRCDVLSEETADLTRAFGDGSAPPPALARAAFAQVRCIGHVLSTGMMGSLPGLGDRSK
jgi:hypothetical protein